MNDIMEDPGSDIIGTFVATIILVMIPVAAASTPDWGPGWGAGAAVVIGFNLARDLVRLKYKNLSKRNDEHHLFLRF